MRVAAAALTIAIVLGAGAPRARGAGSFSAANRAYLSGEYADAARQYEALIAAGIRHEDLFYNLGNAYMRLAATEDDRLGPAILAYERALRLAPELADARYNLAVARAAVMDKVVDRVEQAEGDPLWVRVATRFSIAQLTIGFLVLDAVLFATLILLRFLSSGFVRTGVIVGAVFIGIGGMVAGALLWAHVYFLERVQLAIVLPDETQLRDAAGQPPTDGALTHAGLRVQVVHREPGWVRVRLANGHEGWLPERAVGMVSL